MNQVKLKRLSELIESEIAKENLFDATIRIIKNDKEEYYENFGKDKEDTIYAAYSMTKPITATAVMILYERGMLDFLNPVSDYLEEFKDQKIYGSEERANITIQQCLNMTSGLVYPGEENECALEMKRRIAEITRKYKADEPITDHDVAEAMAGVPLLFHPGERWHYGLSADVLGMVVAKVSGMKYSDFLKKEIFAPLGMKNTDFIVPEHKKDRLATMYSRNQATNCLEIASKEKLDEIFYRGVWNVPAFEAAGSGLYTTVEDYTRFITMLLHKGSCNGVQIVGRKTVDFMSQNQLTEGQRDSIYFDHIHGYGYGNLMRILLDKTAAGSNGSIGEYGWDGMPGNYFLIDPTEQLLVIYMQQIIEGQDVSFRRKMRQIIYGAMD